MQSTDCLTLAPISPPGLLADHERWKCVRHVRKRFACRLPRAVPGTYPTRRRRGGASLRGSDGAYRSFAFVRERRANRHFGMSPEVSFRPEVILY